MPEATKIFNQTTRSPNDRICIPLTPKIPHFQSQPQILCPLPVMPYPILLHTTFQKNQSCPNTNLLRFHARSSENENFLSSLCIANFQLKISKKMFYYFGGILGLISDPIFILHYAMPYTNLYAKFQKNPSMCVESRANTNVHNFRAQTARKFVV